MSCFFCRIINKEIPAEIVYEDADTIAILDIRPKSPGHTLILPKDHAPNILELPHEKLDHLLLAVKKVMENIKAERGAAAFTLQINHGKLAGQEINHLHIHIIPRYVNR